MKNFFRPIENKLPVWTYENDIYSDIIITCRTRLARNLKGFPYYDKLSEKDAEKIIVKVNEVLKNDENLSKNLFLIDLNFLPVEAKKFLRERFIATDYMMRGLNKEIVTEINERYSILVNEEDHLRIQSIGGGLAVDTTFETVFKIADLLEKKIEFDFSEEFGYLTACPTNTGTGLRISAMMHLYGINYTKKSKKLFNSLTESGISIRGLYGEGTSPTGFIYQISNQYTLGESEIEIKEKMKNVFIKIYDMEKESRNEIIKNNSELITNKVKKSLNEIIYSDSIKLNDALELLSNLRLGVSLGLIDSIDFSTLNKLLILIHPMHLLNLYMVPLSEFTKEYENRLRSIIMKKYINETKLLRS